MRYTTLSGSKWGESSNISLIEEGLHFTLKIISKRANEKAEKTIIVVISASEEFSNGRTRGYLCALEW